GRRRTHAMPRVGRRRLAGGAPRREAPWRTCGCRPPGQPGDALAGDPEGRTEDVARGDRAQAHHDVGADARQFALQPQAARALFAGVGTLVQPGLAAALELEMLDGIGDVEPTPLDAQFLERAVEEFARGTDERTAAQVLRLAGLFADDQYARVGRAFAEDRTGGGLPQGTALATHGGIAQRLQAVVDGFGCRTFGNGAP